MSLRLITGRSGSGKTRLCLDEIRSELHRDPLGAPLILLVPEQATFQAEYAMVTTPGLEGFMRAQVLSFRRLAFRVMQETGGSSVIPIQDNGKAMLLHKVLEARRESLRLFRGGKAESGLITKVNELLTEMKRYGVASSQLAKYAESAAKAGQHTQSSLLADKLHDLTLIYSQMEQELAGRWLDGEDMLGWLTKGAAAASVLKHSEIWVDGFHGFTPSEYEVMAGLLKSAERVSVALCLDQPYGAGERPDELHLFHPTAETSAQLCELAQASGVRVESPVLLKPEVSPRFKESPMLAFLEKSWESRKRWEADEAILQPEHPLCGLSLHQAVNRRAEIEAAARDMLRRVRESGARWREMALYLRKVEDYRDLLSAVFDDYGIPYYIDGKASVSHHPFVEFIRSALECVTGGWKTESVFRCAKTDLLSLRDKKASRDDIDRLENYCLAVGIEGWRWHNDRAWSPLYRADLDEVGRGSEGQAIPIELLRTRDVLITPLKLLEGRMKSAQSMRELCESVYYFLEDTGAADQLESWSREDAARGQPERTAYYRPLWDGVIHLLDQLVELMGEQSSDPLLFAGMIDSGLDELKLGAVPPSLDRVLIGSPERTRSDRIQIVYFLGVNDGVLPMRISENGLLAEEERDLLSHSGLTLAPGSRRRLLDEAFLAYMTLTTPSHHLWMSYPLADEEGAGLLPSQWFRTLRNKFPGIPLQTIRGEPQETQSEEEQLAYAVQPGRALTHFITRLRSWRQGEALKPGWWAIYSWLRKHEQWRGRLISLISSLQYSNEEKPLAPETSKLLYGERLLASVSRMERYMACPFQHFAVHGLKLQERRIHRVEAPDIGQLFHAALRQTSEKLFAEEAGSLDVLRWQMEAAAAVDELLPRVQSQILLSSHRHQVMARKLRDIVSQASSILGQHSLLSSFKPVGLELSFGPKGMLPPLSLELEGGQWMDIAGKIDRVDAAESSDGLLLRILDYKSSAMKLKLDEVAHGLSLQMLTYLDVVISHAPQWLGQRAKPAGVLYFHVQNPLLLSANGMSKGEARDAMFREYRMQGLLLANGESVKLMDESLNQSAKSSVIPVEFKKDGAFSARSQVADSSQWEVLRKSVRKQIRTIGKQIVDGNVAITPYRLDRRSPCTFCDYRPVCHFDLQVEGNAYQALSRSSSKEALWQQLAQGVQGGDRIEAAQELAHEANRQSLDR